MNNLNPQEPLSKKTLSTTKPTSQSSTLVPTESRAEKCQRILDSLVGSVPDSGESYEDMLQKALEEKFLT